MTDVYKVALQADKTLSRTHAVRLPVPSADDLMNIFDIISYAKGSVICRMMSDFAEPERFKSILVTYMHRFKY